MRPTLATVTAVVPALIQAEGQQHVGVPMVSMDLGVPTKKVSNDEMNFYFLKRSNKVFTLFTLDTGKEVLWQTVKTQRKCCIIFNLQGQKKNIFFFSRILTP